MKFKSLKDIILGESYKNLGEVYLATHNQFKINEYQKYGNGSFKILDSVPDIDEIDSKDIIEIAKYKAFDMYRLMRDKVPKGASIAIEDTSLNIDGEDVGGNIRWLVNNLYKYVGKKALVTVCFAVCDGEYVKVFRSDLPGVMIPETGVGYGFDPYVEVDGSNGMSLGQVRGDKKLSVKFSIRKMVVENMIADKYADMFNVSSIKEWKGKYQH